MISSGNDLLRGGAGNDIFDAGSGNDTLQGNAGDDHLYAIRYLTVRSKAGVGPRGQVQPIPATNLAPRSSMRSAIAS